MKRYKLKVNEKFHIRTFERTGKRQIARKIEKGSKKIAVFISGCEMGELYWFPVSPFERSQLLFGQ